MSLLFLTAIAIASQMQNMDSLFHDAIQARGKITTYHLVVISKVMGVAGEKPSEFQYEIWRKGTKVRVDRTMLAVTEPNQVVGQREIRCRNCEKEGYHLYAMQSSHSMTGVEYNLIDRANDHFNVDYSILGLRSQYMENYTRGRIADDLIELKAKSTIKIAKILVDTEEITEAKIQHKNPGCSTSIWFSPRRSGNPVKFLLSVPTGKNQMDVEYQERDGIWFPKRIKREVVIENVLQNYEILDFQTVALNCEIDDAIFALAGFGLKNGTPIELPGVSSSERPTWKNGEVDKNYTVKQLAQDLYDKRQEVRAANPVPDVAPTQIERRWPYFVGAGFLATAGVFILRHLRRNRLISQQA